MNISRRILVAIPFLIIIVLGFLFFFDIIIYFFLAGILSIMGHPIVVFFDKLRIGKFKMPHSINALLALITMVTLFAVFIAVVIPVIANQANAISEISVEEVTATYAEPILKLENTLIKFGVLEKGETIEESVSKHITSIVEYIDVSTILQRSFNIAGQLFIGVFAVLFMTFFFLRDDKLFFNGMLMFVPEQYEQQAKHILAHSKRLLTRYFIGLLIELVSMMTLITIGGLIIGVKNAFLIGFLGGMMNIIPYLGPVIGATIGALLVATTNLGVDLYAQLLPLVGGIVVVFIICNLLDNIVLQPLIYSNSVLAHPLEIFIVIMMAGSLAGIPGMILAIPSYTVLRIIAREFLHQSKIVKKLTSRI